MKKLIRFLKKYDFPIHFLVGTMILKKRLSVLLSVARCRAMLLFIGSECGRNLTVDGKVLIWVQKKGTITFGSNVAINSRFGSNPVGLTNPAVLHCMGDGCIQVGDNTGISAAVLSSMSKITLGNHVKIGGNVRIFDHNYHSLDFKNRRIPEQDFLNIDSAPVEIGNDVFIGTNAIILKGVTIGDRSIIGAGSVVSKSVPADEIWAGNPARFVKKMAAEEIE